MPPQEQSTISSTTTSEPIMPNWFKLLFRTYAALLLIAAIFAAVKFGLSIMAHVGAFSSFFSESPLSPTNLLVIGFYALAVLVIALIIAYGVSLFRLRRWTLPILWFFVVSSLLVDGLGIIRGNYSNAGELIGHIVGLAITLGIGYGTWSYRVAFFGSVRKLWLQIPLLAVLIPIAFFSTLAQIYTYDSAVNDADLLLPSVAVLSEADNAHFALQKIDALSPTGRAAFDQAREYYRELEQGEDIDIGAARSALGGITEITDSFIEASRKPGYQCPSLVNRHGLDAVICSLSELRSTAQVVALRSYVEVAQGNMEAALDSAYAPARLGKLVSAEQPLLIEHLVGIALVKTGVESVGRVVNQASSSMSVETASAIIRKLEAYEFDGSSLEKSLKREYMSGKETLRPFERFSGYAWHYNTTHNDFAELTRQKIEVAKARCGGELEQKRNLLDAKIEGMRGSIWWTLLKPNGVGEVLKQVISASMGGVREKECDVNQMSEVLQQRLQEATQ